MGDKRSIYSIPLNLPRELPISSIKAAFSLPCLISWRVISGSTGVRGCSRFVWYAGWTYAKQIIRDLNGTWYCWVSKVSLTNKMGIVCDSDRQHKISQTKNSESYQSYLNILNASTIIGFGCLKVGNRSNEATIWSKCIFNDPRVFSAGKLRVSISTVSLSTSSRAPRNRTENMPTSCGWETR